MNSGNFDLFLQPLPLLALGLGVFFVIMALVRWSRSRRNRLLAENPRIDKRPFTIADPFAVTQPPTSPAPEAPSFQKAPERPLDPFFRVLTQDGSTERIDTSVATKDVAYTWE